MLLIVLTTAYVQKLLQVSRRYLYINKIFASSYTYFAFFIVSI